MALTLTHNCNKFNKTITLSLKMSREFTNSLIFTPSFNTSRPSRDPYRSFKSQHRCQKPRSSSHFKVIALPTLVYPYFALDIEQDDVRKSLLIKQDTE